MPPKGKKGKKGKKGSKKGKEPPVPVVLIPPEPTEKELLLQDELNKVTKELENAKNAAQDLQKHNEWLEQEAQHIRIQSHEYITYLDKKTTKRQTAVVTLSDHFKQEIHNIYLQRVVMEEEYEEKKRALEGLLFKKKVELERTFRALTDLQEYKDLKVQQQAKIRELEHQVIVMRAYHTHNIRKLKADFIAEMDEQQTDSETRIESLERRANKEALQCLINHTDDVKLENQALRRELQGLIQQTRAMNEHQRELDDQRKHLIKEYTYTSDLKKLRGMLQAKSYKKVSVQGVASVENEIAA